MHLKACGTHTIFWLCTPLGRHAFAGPPLCQPRNTPQRLVVSWGCVLPQRWLWRHVSMCWGLAATHTHREHTHTGVCTQQHTCYSGTHLLGPPCVKPEKLMMPNRRNKGHQQNMTLYPGSTHPGRRVERGRCTHSLPFMRGRTHIRRCCRPHASAIIPQM